MGENGDEEAPTERTPLVIGAREAERERVIKLAINGGLRSAGAELTTVNTVVNFLLVAAKVVAVYYSSSISLIASLVDSALDLLSTLIIVGTNWAIGVPTDRHLVSDGTLFELTTVPCWEEEIRAPRCGTSAHTTALTPAHLLRCHDHLVRPGVHRVLAALAPRDTGRHDARRSEQCRHRHDARDHWSEGCPVSAGEDLAHLQLGVVLEYPVVVCTSACAGRGERCLAQRDLAVLSGGQTALSSALTLSTLGTDSDRTYSTPSAVCVSRRTSSSNGSRRCSKTLPTVRPWGARREAATLTRSLRKEGRPRPVHARAVHGVTLQSGAGDLGCRGLPYWVSNPRWST